MKPIYTVKIEQSLQNQWVVTLYEGAAIVRSATYPFEAKPSAEKIYELWKKRFVDKEEKK